MLRKRHLRAKEKKKKKKSLASFTGSRNIWHALSADPLMTLRHASSAHSHEGRITQVGGEGLFLTMKQFLLSKHSGTTSVLCPGRFPLQKRAAAGSEHLFFFQR